MPAPSAYKLNNAKNSPSFVLAHMRNRTSLDLTVLTNQLLIAKEREKLVKIKEVEIPAMGLKKSNIVIENIKQKQEELKVKNIRNVQKVRENAAKF